MKVIFEDVDSVYRDCPYCGSHMILVEDGNKYFTACEEVYNSDLIAQCINCKVETERVNTTASAIDNWNRLSGKRKQEDDYELIYDKEQNITKPTH